MPHYSCIITKPDGSKKNSSATGKDIESARKHAEETHPGCKISDLKLKSTTAIPKTPKQLPKATTHVASKQQIIQGESPVSQRPDSTPIQGDVADNAKLKPNPKTTTSIVDRLFYLQHGKCFYCGNSIHRKDASLDHLLPKSKGGPNGDDNLVVCCKKINLVFNDMSIKQKIQFLMADPGGVTCPEDIIYTLRPGRSEK
jgi:5-methylcytosine-specific restriction endonuclease McrA